MLGFENLVLLKGSAKFAAFYVVARILQERTSHCENTFASGDLSMHIISLTACLIAVVQRLLLANEQQFLISLAVWMLAGRFLIPFLSRMLDCRNSDSSKDTQISLQRKMVLLASTLFFASVFPARDVPKGIVVLFTPLVTQKALHGMVMHFDRLKQALLQRGADLTMALWEYCYLEWGYIGHNLPYGSFIGGYNLSWELLTAVYSLYENHDSLPAESRFRSRWVVLVLGPICDVAMLLGVYMNGHTQLVISIVLWTFAWTVVALLACAVSKKPHFVFQCFKLTAYPAVIFENAAIWYSWLRGEESTRIMLIILVSTLTGTCRRLLKPNAGKLWRFFAYFVFVTHGFCIVICILSWFYGPLS